MTKRHITAYQDLEVWQRAMQLVRRVYLITRDFPSSERYELAAQLRRAAVSVPSNIAEGKGRSGRKDYIRHLLIARGSLQEMETQLLIARDLTIAPVEKCDELLTLNGEVGRLLAGLVRALARPPRRP